MNKILELANDYIEGMQLDPSRKEDKEVILQSLRLRIHEWANGKKMTDKNYAFFAAFVALMGEAENE